MSAYPFQPDFRESVIRALEEQFAPARLDRALVNICDSFVELATKHSMVIKGDPPRTPRWVRTPASSARKV